MEKGKLIVLSGPSGVGKGTVRDVMFEDQSLNLNYSISMTTRQPRAGEEHGVHYFFVSKDEFEDTISNGGFLEYAQFVDNYYGTPKSYVDQLLSEGKNVLLEIEVQGALQVMEQRPEALSIFILPPSLEELEKRIRGRSTETEETIQKRLKQATEELSYKDHYKFNVINDDIQRTADEIAEIIRNY